MASCSGTIQDVEFRIGPEWCWDAYVGKNKLVLGVKTNTK